MRILGIDPGINITGYGIIQEKDSSLEVVTTGAISPAHSKKYPQRLAFIYDRIIQIIDEFQPDNIAVEDSFYGKNARTALVLGQARGVILLASAHRKIPCYEYAPKKVKMSVVGNGSASKEQVQYMVKAILNYKGEISKYDISDALAVALCHSNQYGVVV